MRSWLWLTALLVVAAGCRGEARPTAVEVEPDLVFEGVTLRYFRGSDLKAVGKARLATMRRDQGEVTAYSLDLRLIGAQEGTDVLLKAAQATGNLRTQLAEAGGGVRLADANGLVGTTDRCLFDLAAGRALGSSPITLSAPGMEVSGETGFAMDLQSPGTIMVNGPTRSVLRGHP